MVLRGAAEGSWLPGRRQTAAAGKRLTADKKRQQAQNQMFLCGKAALGDPVGGDGIGVRRQGGPGAETGEEIQHAGDAQQKHTHDQNSQSSGAGGGKRPAETREPWVPAAVSRPAVPVPLPQGPAAQSKSVPRDFRGSEARCLLQTRCAPAGAEKTNAAAPPQGQCGESQIVFHHRIIIPFKETFRPSIPRRGRFVHGGLMFFRPGA